MKKLVLGFCLAALLCSFFGCLASPVARSGGPGSITVPNTNRNAVRAAAQSAFAEAGYSPGSGGSAEVLSFERPAGAFGHLMFGSYGRSTTFRVRVQAVQLPGTNDFRLIPRVSRVNNAGEQGFESDTKMMRFWSGQFRSIMRKIKAEAGNAGPGF